MELGAPATAQLSQSLSAFMKSPGQSQIEELESMGVMEYMLMLLLQTSRRLADLESTTYYTHFLPVAHPLHAQMEETYQSYLHAVQENKEHKLGPPTTHRYKAILEFIAKQAPLKSKDGLAPLVASV